MFCVRCGRPTEGEKIVCDECAAKEAAKKQPAPVVEEKPAPIVEEAPAPVVEAAPAPAEEPKAPETPVVEAPAFTVNTNVTEVPKKKRKGAVGWIIVAVLLVAAIVAAVLCWPMIQGLFNNTDDEAGSTETTEATVAGVQTGTAVETVGAAYGAFLEGLKNPATTGESTVSLTLGEDLISLLESSLTSQDVEMDLSWLESLALNMQSGMDGDSYGVDMGVLLNGTDILTLSVFMDIAEGMCYIGVPEVNDTYLSVAMTEDMGFDPSVLTTAMNAPKEMAATLAEELPSQEAFEAALEKYITLIAENLPEGEQEQKDFVVNGVAQKLTATTRKLTEQDALNIAIAVLEAAKDDETVKQFITAVCDYVNAQNAMNAEMSGYDYIDELNPSEVIAAIPDMIEELKGIDTDDSTVTLVLYTDEAGNLCGGSLEDPDGNLMFDCVSVSEGDKSAMELKLPDNVKVIGDSYRENGMEYSSYALDANGDIMLTVFLEGTVDGKIGVIRLVPGVTLLEELSYDYPILGMASSAAPELMLKLYDDGMELDLILNGNVFAGLGLNADGSTSYKPAKPGSSVSVEDQAGLLTWLTELDISGVSQSLKDAGVPADLVDAFVTGFQQGLAGSQSPEVETPNTESVVVPGEIAA
ncbi:MAG: hypothetical protein IJZ56_00215 [Oscillospiraceae bacterium]|nr:hypothetical protein [Oscillospiraceae bacterium]